MSWPEYRKSRDFIVSGESFATFIMAAMRKSDTYNLEILQAGWPQIWGELQKRYNAPGGFLTEQEKERFG